MLLQLHVGRSIVYIQGKQFIISKIIVFLLLMICFVLANSADPDMRHFNWVFSVCQSIRLWVSGLQRVKR